MALKEDKIKEMAAYWREAAEHDWGTARALWRSKRYDACLFYCHLSMEKLLKGLVVKKTKESPPYIHDLVELSKRAGIPVGEDEVKALATFTSFNLSGRYPKDKFAFYKQCTFQFTRPYYREARRRVLWLKEFYQKNK